MSEPPPMMPQTPAVRSQAVIAFMLIVLMGLWMILFTLGSQVPSSTFQNSLMRNLTTSTPNIIMLGCVSALIGVLKRHLMATESKPLLADYLSGLISGFVTAIAVLAFPGVVSSLKVSGNPLFVPDQGTYNVFSLVASYLSYQSGHDVGFSDRMTKKIFDLVKLG